MAKRLYHLAHEWGEDVLVLLKIAKTNGIKYTPSEDDIEVLKRKISGYYDLTDGEIRSLDDFLKSEPAKNVLEETVPLLEFLDTTETNKYLGYIARKLYEVMGKGELKSKIRPETLKETVMNLGVVTVHRSSAATPTQERPIPMHLLRFDKNVAKGVIKRYLLQILQTVPITSATDFDKAKTTLNKAYKRLKEYDKS